MLPCTYTFTGRGRGVLCIPTVILPHDGGGEVMGLLLISFGGASGVFFSCV
jgi:hypothetical protein